MRLDVCNIGGLTEAMKVACRCEAHHVDLIPHHKLGPQCTAASIRLAAAVPNCSWLECNRRRGRPPPQIEIDLFPVAHLLNGDSFPVPDTPGIASRWTNARSGTRDAV